MLKLSLKTAQVTEDWRRAIVTPAAKSPRTTDPRQFRLISLTSVACKILQTILKEKLLSHLSKLSLLTTRQHGFLRRRSTVTNLLSAEETVTRWLDEGETFDIFNLDFAKAFDSVNHRLLLTKLKCYGIAPSVISWFESSTTLLPSKCQRIPIASGRGCKWNPSRFSIWPYPFCNLRQLLNR